MERNPLQRLQDYGQSVWNDNLSRNLIVSGGLQDLIDNSGVVGVTSNPTIFDTAISKSDDYDDMIRELVAKGRNTEETYEALVVRDIQMACDILRPIYDRQNKTDGFVSLEVSPLLARDTEKTIEDARRLWNLVDRPNLMIKIPGTEEGVPAIEQMLYEGININITLLFSLGAYRQVAEAYIRALERRVADGKPVDSVASVASFFVSRVDTEVDKRLQAIIDNDEESDAAILARSLLGEVAVANAKLAYQVFRELFYSDRFDVLAGRGARFQRPLWASTSTKNPAYSDTLYVDTLIGPNTVQTLAPASIEAFGDHGTVRPTLEADVPGAYDVMTALDEAGIDFDEVEQVLIDQGIDSFAKSFNSLMSGLEEKIERFAAELDAERSADLGKVAEPVRETLGRLEADDIPARLGKLDASIWTDDGSVKAKISQRLGWLPTVAEMLDHAESGLFESFANEVSRRGYRYALLLGMGGSSLAPEVMATVFGQREGFPELIVLDSTHPETVERITRQTGDDRTLLIVSSKSGGTIETRTLFQHFLASRNGIAADVVVITDPGSPLEVDARAAGCWRVFTNRPDIGGRYSALSFFGLIPAAAVGIDVTRLLRNAANLLPIHSANHPGVWLGAVMAAAREQGRDKLTLFAPGAWQSLGDWLEQLIAESTGKNGTGILPVVRETPRNPADYGDDRLFVELSERNSRAPLLAPALQDQGHPVVSLNVESPFDLGSSFLLWEIATAVAGALMGINPFDEPSVQEAKDATNAVLRGEVDANPETVAAKDAVTRIIEWASPGDYIAILAFADRNGVNDRALENLRDLLGAHTGLATTLGYGPRYLHSTGQLHKGGAANGIYMLVVDSGTDDLDIPGEAFSFGKLFMAQAIGDAITLNRHNRRLVTVDANGDLPELVREIMLSCDQMTSE
jgi:transaldolase/glucose-6-phosphate isomerase